MSAATAASGNGNGVGAVAGNRALLMAGNALAPCIGCTLECFPRSCELFTEWIGLLEKANGRGPDPLP